MTNNRIWFSRQPSISALRFFPCSLALAAGYLLNRLVTSGFTVVSPYAAPVARLEGAISSSGHLAATLLTILMRLLHGLPTLSHKPFSSGPLYISGERIQFLCDQPINRTVQRYAFALSAQANRSTLGIASKSAQRLSSFLRSNKAARDEY